MSQEKITCPECKGTGKIEITMSFYGSDEKPSVTKIDCVTCNGLGKLSKQEFKEFEEEKELWCSCGNPSEQVKYWKDGEGTLVHKHHYTCKDCGKVVQIG